jgi:glucosamine--fructose-6-phosphate aminotransferase (isomerizing)
MTSPYELDIADQPRALTALLTSELPDLSALRSSGFEKIVLTGMGSSHYAAYSTWRTMLASYPTWWVPTNELLDTLDLVDGKTLLWMTSSVGSQWRDRRAVGSPEGCPPAAHCPGCHQRVEEPAG